MAEAGLYSQASVVMATLVTIVTSMALPGTKEDTDINLFMPGVQPQNPDTYLCFPHALTAKTLYLTGFEPHANKSITHHMLLYGCTDLGSSVGVWNCGEMSSRNGGKEIMGPVCKSGAKILYAWAMDAPNLKLPEAGFEPHANKSIAHHMLLYGCTDPGSSVGVWNCGEMSSRNGGKEIMGPVCKSGAKILYAWAMDAPDLKLPEGVGFKVGGDTSIKTLVLQVHYKDVTAFLPPKLDQDHSGLKIKNTEEPQPKLAGVYLLGTNGEIPPHETVYMETACSYNDDPVLHPFAFRTHAHTHGEVVSGYRVRDGDWEEIGRESPRKPQMFYTVSHPDMTVRKGDMLAARCTMVNDDNRTVEIGATQEDEMCNFYMMYWTDSEQPISRDYCFSAGPPEWNWNDDPLLNAGNAPKDASIIPGTDKLLKASEKFVHQTQEKMDKMTSEIEQDFLRLLEELQLENEEEQSYDDVYYPSEGREMDAPYNQAPYDVDEEEEEYNEIMEDYPELMDTYQRAMRADSYNRQYQDWLQEYYDQ